MNKKALKADLLLLLTACIWGFGFVAQRAGMEHIGPFAFNGIRFILGSLSLLPIIMIRRKTGVSASPLRGVFAPSLVVGTCLFVAVMLQQLGMLFTTAGNAGFITGLYVILTPIFGIFLGRKTGRATWLGAAVTFAGLYVLSVADSYGALGGLNPGDIIIIISSFFWVFHILSIDHFVQRHCEGAGGAKKPPLDPLELSVGQFWFCGLFALAGGFLLEPHIASIVGRFDPSLLEAGLFAWIPLPDLAGAFLRGSFPLPAQALITVLYGGIVSVGVAYTLQVVAQRDTPPAHATIILCLEGSFAALGGVLLLSERVGPWSLLGFALMLLGMIVTQWEVVVKAKL